VQATDFGDLYDPSRVGELDWPGVRRILVEREVRAILMIILEVAGQNATQVRVAEDENVIQTLAPNRTDRALGERILPGAVRRGPQGLRDRYGEGQGPHFEIGP
jgi:hypothetical protein